MTAASAETTAREYPQLTGASPLCWRRLDGVSGAESFALENWSRPKDSAPDDPLKVG